ncbi:MAG TPA: hypothetical protein VFC42_13445 [Methylomirabilota bacterium]|nr:hypothetical protein [Methylomirabilota bacterium]
MRRAITELLTGLAGVAGVLLMPGLAPAEVSVNINIGPPPPIVVAAPPTLVAVPAVPTVSYVPALDVDVFVYGGRWYYAHGGHWFVGPSYRGPWTFVAPARVPRPILAVPVRYYKIPPGHLKHVGGPPGSAKGHGR